MIEPKSRAKLPIDTLIHNRLQSSSKRTSTTFLLFLCLQLCTFSYAGTLCKILELIIFFIDGERFWYKFIAIFLIGRDKSIEVRTNVAISYHQCF